MSVCLIPHVQSSLQNLEYIMYNIKSTVNERLSEDIN